jgi:hypothetical protein
MNDDDDIGVVVECGYEQRQPSECRPDVFNAVPGTVQYAIKIDEQNSHFASSHFVYTGTVFSNSHSGTRRLSISVSRKCGLKLLEQDGARKFLICLESH